MITHLNIIRTCLQSVIVCFLKSKCTYVEGIGYKRKGYKIWRTQIEKSQGVKNLLLLLFFVKIGRWNVLPKFFFGFKPVTDKKTNIEHWYAWKWEALWQISIIISRNASNKNWKMHSTDRKSHSSLHLSSLPITLTFLRLMKCLSDTICFHALW